MTIAREDGRFYFCLSAEPVAPIGTAGIKGPAWHVCGGRLDRPVHPDGYICANCGERGFLVEVPSEDFTTPLDADKVTRRQEDLARRLADAEKRADLAMGMLSVEQRRLVWDGVHAAREAGRS